MFTGSINYKGQDFNVIEVFSKEEIVNKFTIGMEIEHVAKLMTIGVKDNNDIKRPILFDTQEKCLEFLDRGYHFAYISNVIKPIKITDSIYDKDIFRSQGCYLLTPKKKSIIVTT